MDDRHRPSEHPDGHRRGRLTGLPGLLGVLRNLGLIGRPAPPGTGEEMQVLGDGQSLSLRVRGQGPPVMLVHGLGCSQRYWVPVVNRIASRHTVITWDARGHGRCTPVPGTRVTLARLALDLHELIESLQFDRVALVGHSMGALTVMQYLHDHGTRRAAAVTLIDQSPRIVTGDDWRLGLFGGCSPAMLTGLIASARRDLAETVVDQVGALAGEWLRPRLAANSRLGRLLRQWLQDVDAAALLDLAESLVMADFRALLPRLDVPLWVLLGGRSAHYADVPLGDYYQGTVPHASISRYERSGHSPHVAEPDRFARDLLQFLADHA